MFFFRRFPLFGFAILGYIGYCLDFVRFTQYIVSIQYAENLEEGTRHICGGFIYSDRYSDTS